MHRRVLALSPIMALLTACSASDQANEDDDTQATQTDTGAGTDDTDDTDDTNATEPTCAETECAASAETFCYPCSPTSEDPEPWLSLGGASGFVDGDTMELVCGPQGFWMFEMRPSYGGFTLQGATVRIDYEVRVEDFNIIDGRFAKGGLNSPALCCDITDYYEQQAGLYACNQDYLGLCYSYSYALGSFRFFPPDSIPTLSDLDGKMVEVDISMTAGDAGPQDFQFTGTVSVSGEWEDCGYYDAASPEAETPFGWSGGERIPLARPD